MGRRRSASIAVVVAFVGMLLGSSAPAPAAAAPAAAAPATGSAGAAPAIGSPVTGSPARASGATGSITPEVHQVDLRTAPRTAAPNEVHGLDRLTVPRSTPQTYIGPSPRLATPATSSPSPGFAPQVAGAEIEKGANFPGQKWDCSSGSHTCLEPPNTAVAVSSAYVVEFDNTVAAIYDRSGNKLITPVPFDVLFAEPAGETGDSDPHVLYDAAKDRWFATELSWSCATGVGNLYLAVSKTGDPRGTWSSFRFAFDGYLTDYPDLAVSSDKVAVSTNLYPILGGSGHCFGSFDAGLLGVMDLSAVLAGTPTLEYSVDPDYVDAASWRPAGDPTSSTIYAIGEGFDAGILYGRITGTQAGKNVAFAPVYDLTAHGLGEAFDPDVPMPRQPGTPSTIANAFDERATDAVWYGNRLWFVATAGCTPSGDSMVRDCVRLVQLVTNATPSVNQDFLIADDGFDDFMGGIGLTVTGNLFVVYSQSSPSAYISTYARMQAPTATKNTIDAPILVDQGTVSYKGTRWGDYVIPSSDPLQGATIWEPAEYPDAATGWWTTRISELKAIDATKPSGTFAIDAGAPRTAHATVTITDTATDDLTGIWKIQLSNDGSHWGSKPYATSLSWDMTSATFGGSAAFGMKTIYVRWLDGAGNVSAVVSHTIQYVQGIDRYAGTTRYATAAAISANTFSPGVAVAYIARADAFPDALAGAAAAGTVKGPVLLAATSGALDPATTAELTRLQPDTIIVLGGTAAISDAVLGALTPYATSHTVLRYAGATRFATAATISAHTFSPGVGTAYIARADAFPDALAGAAAAGTVKGPVLLAATSGTLDGSTRAELLRLHPAHVVVLGGTAAIGASVYSQLAALPFSHTMTRDSGSSRFATAAAISAHTFSPGVGTAYVAYAFDFPDALAGAAAAGTVQGPVLLAATSGPLDPATITELQRLKPQKVVVLGGTKVISDAVKAALFTYVP
ncbi:MAG TPA: cell wall-binding repeat-containing protein [Candidatus Limnocylindrales bacterium]|nr:cell wall-binding repeat-containing protein [Candidatus Limnocylindrales bacterium]